MLPFLIASPAFAQGTAFTYQGLLSVAGTPAAGYYDFQFGLYNATSNSIGTPITNNAVLVSNGIFITTLDFGSNAFMGGSVLLGIGVRPSGSNVTFMALTPLQPVTPTPNAIYSLSAGVAGNLASALSSGSLSGTYSSIVAISNAADHFTGTFSGNGVGLSNVTATSLGGLGPGSFWQISGNSGTSPAQTNFLGTVDDEPLEIHVNGGRAFRLEPNTQGAPNVIGGAAVNLVDPGVVGATIAGGGAVDYFPSVSYTNRVSADFGVISGGANNFVETNATYSVITGGTGNDIQANSSSSTITGGQQNVLQPGSLNSTITGGIFNGIESNAFSATITGGQGNHILANASFTTIVGGGGNTIQISNNYSIIGGGGGNTIESNVSFGTIAGGSQNVVAGNYGFAGGQLAEALHPGAFVWADSTSGIFASTASNQFDVRANGGVRFQGDSTNATADATQVLVQANANTNQQLELGYKAAGNYGSMQSIVQGTGPSTLALQPVGGSVGINMTNPTYTLQVNGSVAGVGAYNNVSDVRYKTNITLLVDALDKIMKLRGVRYDWRTNDYPQMNFDDGAQFGFIAQEMKEVLPEVVSQDKQGYYSIAYSKVIPVLVEALKEAEQERKSALLEKDAEIADLQKRLSKLEEVVKGLTKENAAEVDKPERPN